MDNSLSVTGQQSDCKLNRLVLHFIKLIVVQFASSYPFDNFHRALSG